MIRAKHMKPYIHSPQQDPFYLCLGCKKQWKCKNPAIKDHTSNPYEPHHRIVHVSNGENTPYVYEK